MSVIRQIWAQVTPELEVIIEEVTKCTKLIKDLEANPTVEMVIGIIPGGSKYEAILNAALDEINGVTTVVDNFAHNLTAWLATYATPLELNGGLLKLASTAIQIADPETGGKTESVYDTLAQTHIILEQFSKPESA